MRHGVGALDYLIFCFPLDLCLDSQYRRRWNLASHMKSAKDQHNAWEKTKKKNEEQQRSTEDSIVELAVVSYRELGLCQ